MATIGSILHGAYGDYYEQLVCLKHFKRTHPADRLILFFASEHRYQELKVLDLSFADKVHAASALTSVPVDRFLQYQIKDEELQADVLAKLPAEILAKFDRAHLKPWSHMRAMDLRDPANDIGLSPEGRNRLPQVMEGNSLDDAVFQEHFTVGFLWRHRATQGAISSSGQTPEQIVLESKAQLFTELIHQYDAHVVVAGMNAVRTPENWYRIEAKFSDKRLNLPEEHCTYLKGLSWALELEIMRRCSLCIVMPSGFSEALWMKRSGPTVLVDPPPHYLAKLLWHRMLLFDVKSLADVWFQFRQPHTAARVMRYLERRGLLPLGALASRGA
jgi:hypothetical protein